MRKARQIVGTLLGTGLLVSLCLAGPAAASTSSQAAQAAVTGLSAAPAVSEAQIYLTHARAYNWITHGNNAQLTVQGPTATLFYLTSATPDFPGTGPWYKIHVANSSHCVEGEGNGDTRVIATDCEQGNENQKWLAIGTGNGGCFLQDEANGKSAEVYNPANGKPVWMGASTDQGAWLAWSTPLWQGC